MVLERVKEWAQPSAQDVVDQAVRSLTTVRARAFEGGSRLDPSFLVIGAQRCGTTSLYKYLTQHPQVSRSLVKEVHFFDLNYGRGPAWYSAHFAPGAYTSLVERWTRSAKVTGEATPYYLFHPLAPERIRQHLPDAKLVVLLRDPVSRAVSHYRHERALGAEELSFEDAIEREPERLAGEEERLVADPSYVSFAHQHFSYVARGHYLEQLQRWHALFPPEQMLIVNSNEFFKAPDGAYRRVLRFLELPEVPLRNYKQHNTYSAERIDDGVRRHLVEHFAEPNRALYEYLGTDFGWSRP